MKLKHSYSYKVDSLNYLFIILMEIIFSNKKNCWTKTSLEDFLKYNTPVCWYSFFKREDICERIHTISNFLRHEASHNITIYPDISNVFRALYMIDPNEINLVILGQDPYHDGAATGLAFDVPNNRKLNPSLRNIMKELDSCGFETFNNINHWPSEGILLINTAFTVRKDSPGSHTDIWNDFIEELIKYIGQKKQIVWLLMGSHAHSYTKFLPNIKQHIVIKTTHPSPLSAFRSTKKIPAFIGSNCFKTINVELIRIGKEPIKF